MSTSQAQFEPWTEIKWNEKKNHAEQTEIVMPRKCAKKFIGKNYQEIQWTVKIW